MTEAQLAALSTIAWIVGIVSVFVLLARWSDGGSWGISSAVARGLIGWAGRNGAIAGTDSASAGDWRGGELPPMDVPELDQLWAGGRDPASVEGPPLPPNAFAEIEDLGSRPIGR